MMRSMQSLPAESKNRWRLLLPALAMVALGFLGMGASPASAGEDPFVASISGTVGPGTGGPSTFTLAATGTSGQLGGFSYAGTVEVTSTVPLNSPPPTAIALADTLTETLTLANGNTLTILCFQSAVQITSNSPYVYRGSDRWTVIGGTGNFKGATGSGTGDTYVDLLGGTFIKVLSGTVSKIK